EDLAADVDGDLAGEVAVGDGGGDLGDVPDLRGQVAGHRVDGVGEVRPRARHATHVGLAAELALGAEVGSHARQARGERAALIGHRVDGVLELEDFAVDVDGALAGEVAVGDGGGDLGDVPDLGRQVAGHRVDAIGEVAQRARHAFDAGLAAELALGADLAGDARDFGGEGGGAAGRGVDGVLELEHLDAGVGGDLAREVDGGDGGGDLGDVADLGGQVTGHGVDGIGEVLPGAGHVADVGLAAELALGADLAGDARDFVG